MNRGCCGPSTITCLDVADNLLSYLLDVGQAFLNSLIRLQTILGGVYELPRDISTVVRFNATSTYCHGVY